VFKDVKEEYNAQIQKVSEQEVLVKSANEVI
jgi:hypothetical protein